MLTVGDFVVVVGRVSVRRRTGHKTQGRQSMSRLVRSLSRALVVVVVGEAWMRSRSAPSSSLIWSSTNTSLSFFRRRKHAATHSFRCDEDDEARRGGFGAACSSRAYTV